MTNQPFLKSGCVIMASGYGKRFGENKLMADFRGKPMIERILDVTDGLFEKRVVVTRYEDVANLCRMRDVLFVRHDFPFRSDTVRIGIENMDGVNRCMFCPGDQPLLTRDTIKALLLSSTNEQEFIWRPCFDETPGAPVIFPKWTFEELLNLPEGKGGDVIMKKYPDKVKMVEISNAWELLDADTPESLDILKGKFL